MNLIERAKAPTPKFFKLLRTIGLTLAAAGGMLLTTPIALSAAIVAHWVDISPLAVLYLVRLAKLW